MEEMNRLRSVNVFKAIIDQLNQTQFDDVAVDESVVCEALKQYPGFPVVFSGGVASIAQLRQSCRDFDAVFSPPEFSTDNAMGIAVLTWLQGV